MPVFGNRNVDIGGVDDRRGRRASPAAIGGGTGVVGLIVYLLIQFLGGSGAPGALSIPGDTSVRGTGETLQQLKERCNADGGIEKYNDCYLIKVYNEINDVWASNVSGYARPRLAFFEQSVDTGCGAATSEVGPFYCPPDREVFIDIEFLNALQKQFGAAGRYAQAYILAHEIGHHLQNITGIEARIRAEQRRNPKRKNELSIAMELQADCYAGVWGRLANDAGKVTISEAELDEALNAAAAVGDDRIQKQSSGRVDPETWTHGSAEQRRSSYTRGYRGGILKSCS